MKVDMDFKTATQDEKREYITEQLRSGIVTVTFTKVNGEQRVMPCTLQECFLPPVTVHYTNTDNPIDFPTPKKERKVNPDIISAFCTDKQEWRSFRIDSVLGIK